MKSKVVRSGAVKYLHTFSDYKEAYMPLISKHEEVFNKVSFDLQRELEKIDMSDMSTVRKVYVAFDVKLCDEMEKITSEEKVDITTLKERAYIERLSAQFTTRYYSFKHDPEGVHKIHKKFTKDNYKLGLKGKEMIPPLGRRFEDVKDPLKTLGKTRSAKDMEKDFQLKEKSEMKLKPAYIKPSFLAHPTGEVEKIEFEEAQARLNKSI